MKPEYGICSGCGQRRRLRASGTLGSHYKLTKQGYNTGSICSGVDLPPKEIDNE